ncbi:ABC transporter permease [Dactylosporangium roseum]|uniref:ABC transporter permease n=1 Tax=Dactylosporangium roseum TaxID=47989 RepID=A0ABY5ZB04_9ACTN|nr:ABC transporter permease [Dactylosporangium roseum]UWZ39206.1 ABC transporter permease [Dactylosporangium roseum]
MRSRLVALGLSAVLGLVFVSICLFALLRAIPGDPARLLAGPSATGADIERIRADLGLDQPLPVQYWSWVTHVLHGDFGVSLNGREVFPQVWSAFVASASLAVVGMVAGLLIGVPAGLLAARFGGVLERAARGLSVVGISVPIFVTGVSLVGLFAVKLHWLPATGRDDWRSYLLPAATIGLYQAAYLAQITRSGLKSVLEQPFIATCKAKGISSRAIFLRHGLPNIRLQLTTISVIQFGYLLGGAALTETVFAWPGVGRLLVSSLAARDFAMVQGAILLTASAVLALVFIADLAVTVLDPRVRSR